MTNIDKTKTYSPEEAIALSKENCKCKFDSTVELHFNLGINHKKPEQTIRVTTSLPHGTGKTVRVATFCSQDVPSADLQLTEDDLKKIEKNEIRHKVDFDVLVSEPKYMPKLAKVARILGPSGAMPNPKSGTVTDDVEKAVEQIKKGKIIIRNEADAPMIHVGIGKKSFTDEALLDNFNEVLHTIKSNRPQKIKPDNYIRSCYMTTTMGPSVQVSIN